MSFTKRHPAALPFLFLTEMWERFGFYVVQGILVLYLTKSFGFSDNESYSIVGAFAALSYISPILGGLVADKILGFKLAIIWGAGFLIAGYALLAIPGSHAFYTGLATIIVGTGLFKPNISTLLGALYAPGDTQRDTGFTLFYIGINLGVLLSGVSDLIRAHFGWHVVFMFASGGLFFGLCVFFLGIYSGKMKYNHAVPLLQGKLFLRKPFLALYCIGIIVLLSILLHSGVLGKWLLPLLGIFILFFIFLLAYQQETEDRKRLLTLNILIISSVIFWAIYLQIFFAANLFIDRLIEKQVFGITIPTTIFYALESIIVILLGPIFAFCWQKLNAVKKNPSPFLKFFFALIFVGLAFLALGASTWFAGKNNLINPLWIVLAYFLITTGELLLSPIGLSAVTLLSPPQLTGMMMGIWFVALGYGGQFAGMLAKIASIPESVQNAAAQLSIYRHAFFDYAWLAFGVAIILFFVQMLVRKSLLEE